MAPTIVTEYLSDWRVLAGSCSLALVLYHLVPYALDTHRLRGYPGPFLAKFSDFWLALLSRGGHRSEKVHELHEKYGTCVIFADQYSAGSASSRPLRSHCPKPPLYRAPRCAANGVRARQRRAQVRLLRRFCGHPPRSLQHPRPRGAYPQAEDRLPHILAEEC